MKTTHRNLTSLAALCVAIVLLIAVITAYAQTVPVLSIANTGTNQISITITNNIGTADYDLEWTPVLANANYPWTYAAIGVPGGTNYIIETAGYPAGFYQAILDTNAVPLWEAANPGNPASPILKVMIASPANGSNLN